MPSVWYDLSPMGLQVKRLNDTVNQLKAQMNSDEMEPHGGKLSIIILIEPVAYS